MSTIGNKGKFSERIKKIAINKNKRKKTDIEDSDELYKNFLKVVAAIPLLVYDNVVNVNSENQKSISEKSKINDEKKDFEKQVLSDESIDRITYKIADRTTDSIAYQLPDRATDKISNEIKKDGLSEIADKRVSAIDTNGVKRKKYAELINQIDVSLIKKRQDEYYNNANIDNNKDEKETENDNIEQSRELEKKIINRIKKYLIKTVNELEILQSELYLVSEVNGDSKTLKECQATLDEVKKMLCKIDILKKKYDFLKDNYDFEYMLEIDDNDLIENIIELKDKFSNNEVKAVVDDYKLLDVYKYLYLRIDKLEEQTAQFEEYKENQLLELKERDINFDKLKSDVYNIDRINDSYELFVKNQKDYLDGLNDKISKIDSYERVNYKLKGFNEFLFNSFKYVGLLMLSPLKGVIPSIATETLLTRNIVGNLYNNLEWQESRKMVYEAIDYSSEINNAIDDLDYTDRVVSGTLEDIVNLKIKYNEQFKKYQGDFSEYEAVIGKINDMENKILGNKIKIEIMKKRMLEKERQNSKKLELVKKLNDSSEEKIV